MRFNEILENNQPAKYGNKWEIANLLKQAVKNGEISETEREWQQKDALTLIHIIEKAPASQRNYAIRLLKLFIAATGTSST